MPWHKFKENISYQREEVIAECERRIDSGAVENTDSARWYLGHIAAADADMLRFKPFGTKSFGRCPWNPSVWQTDAAKPIWIEQPLPKGLGK